MSQRWRIIDTGAMDPFANMALDETLLRSYRDNSSQPTLRIYGWSRPGLSIGYSQDPDKDLDIGLCRARSVPVVRRITGGGIMLHANELTYSIACRKEDLGVRSQVEASYKAVSLFLISFYNALGLDAAFACDIPSVGKLGRPSVLCFASMEKHDIVVDGKKIGGNAQKRSRDVIFQHGSIPFNFRAGPASSFLRTAQADNGIDSATCLEELLGIEMDVARLSRILVTAFVRTFGLKPEDGILSPEEEAIFAGLKADKYGTDCWNYHRKDKWKESSSARRG